jgi:hypothetical protein
LKGQIRRENAINPRKTVQMIFFTPRASSPERIFGKLHYIGYLIEPPK